MKKILITVLALVLALGSASAFVGCAGKTFTVEYVIEGMEVPSDVQTTLNVSVDEIALWTPTAPSGKVFDGWYELETYTGFKSATIAPLNTANKKFYGRLVDASYEIKYNLKDLDGTAMDTSEATVTAYEFPYNHAVTLWYPVPSGTGIVFDGWYSSADFTGERTFQILASETGDREYYGRFKEGTGDDYTIEYVISGEKQTGNIMPATYATSTSVILLWTPLFNASEVSFDGWYESANFTGTKMDRIPANASGNKTFYGRYREPEAYNYDGKKVKALEFVGRDRNNVATALSDFYGVKPVVINVWATWCGPCKDEMPHFEELFHTRGNDIEFMMVNAGGESKSTITDFIDAGHKDYYPDGYTFPVYVSIDSGTIANLYGINNYPTTILVDKWGYVVRTVVGAVSKANLEKYINEAVRAAK